MCAHKYNEVDNEGLTNGQLYNISFERIPRTENIRLDRVFKLTLKKILYGKVYKDSCLRNTPYNDFGWWARTQPNYMRIGKRIMETFVKEVNQIDKMISIWEFRK